jgi:hypothetical protein
MPILTPASQDDIQKILDLHQRISNLADLLANVDPNDYDLDPIAKSRFLSARFWFDDYKRRLAIHALTVIVSRLIALESDLKAGTTRLEEELQEVEDFLEVLLLMEKVVLLVGQVIVFGSPFGG